jgi:hypothetical protein
VSSSSPPTTPLQPRHGFNLCCHTCGGAQTQIGGIESAKQFSKIIKDTAKKHKTHDYDLKQSYHAAELAHASQTQTTRQTTTSTTYGDFTNNSIAAASFTAGKKYLISVTAGIDTNSVTGGLCSHNQLVVLK